MINTFIFVLCLVTSGASLIVNGNESIFQEEEEDFELEQQLKLINKLPIKTINVFYNLLINYLILSFVESSFIVLTNIFFMSFVFNLQTQYGDIIDCIDINKQLAFDHPYLRIISSRYIDFFN